MAKKVIIRHKKAFIAKVNGSKQDNLERKAILKIVSPKESVYYRESIAANIPVTYISNGVIYREVNGKRTAIGNVAQQK